MNTTCVRFSAVWLALTTLMTLPGTAAAGGAIFLKGGAMHLRDDRQMFDTPTHVPVEAGLDRLSNKTGGIGVEHRFRNGWAAGFDYLHYENRFTQTSLPAARGLAETDAFMLSAKKYFFLDSRFRPYVAGGVGFGHSDISNKRGGGPVDDLNTSLLLQVVLGVELRVDNLSLLLEAKSLHFDVSNSDVEYNPSTTGVLLGMGFSW